MAGLAGFLLAKTPAHSRRKRKDWYDIADVLLHNDAGGVDAAASAVLAKIGRARLDPHRSRRPARQPHRHPAAAPSCTPTRWSATIPALTVRHCWPML